MEQPKGSEDVFVLHERFQMLCNEVLFATQLQDYGCHICYMQVLSAWILLGIQGPLLDDASGRVLAQTNRGMVK